MLSPNQYQFAKMRKGRVRFSIEKRGQDLKFGLIGLQALEPGKISARQIESVRRTLSSVLKRKGKIWIRIFPDKSITAKPAEVRMGKGKGNLKYWVAPVKPGTILFEITSHDHLLMETALKKALIKLPVRTKIWKKIL